LSNIRNQSSLRIFDLLQTKQHAYQQTVDQVKSRSSRSAGKRLNLDHFTVCMCICYDFWRCGAKETWHPSDFNCHWL